MVFRIKSRLRRCALVTLTLGLILALAAPVGAQKKQRKRQGRPIALGVSGGNDQDLETEREGGFFNEVEQTFCNSGTLGSLLEMQDNSTTTYFILSTNFAIAQTNRANRGNYIVQPGLSDSNCKVKDGDRIAALSGWKKIKFTGAANTVDVAIAETTPDLVKTTGEILKIGIPSSESVAPTEGLRVKKGGAGSGVTRGTVYLTNATVEVPYPRTVGADLEYDLALFKNQIVVVSENPGQRIIAAGDSGSLLVEDTTSCPAPVGLVFAGNEKGDILVANKMQKVLKAVKKIKPKGTKTVVGCGEGFEAQNSAVFLDPAEEHSQRVAERVQRRVERQILDLPGVNGIGATLDERLRPMIVVFMDREDEVLRQAIPAEIDGIVTDVFVVGTIVYY